MSALATAVLSGTLALVTAVVTTGWRLRSERQARQREAIIERLERYREPLVVAAFDLQRRLYQVISEDFLSRYMNATKADSEYAIRSTQWLLAQYFGWWELLRREVQFLEIGDVGDNRKLVQSLSRISDIIDDPDPNLGPELRIWSAEQRALGELMLVDSENEVRSTTVMGYDSFATMLEGEGRLSKRIHRLDEAVHSMAVPDADHTRAILLQRALVDLIDILDDDRSRFPVHLRSKLPLAGPLSVAEAAQLTLAQALPTPHADFRFSGEPWAAIAEWADHFGFTTEDTDAGKRYSRRRKSTGIMEVVDVNHTPDSRVIILGHMVRPWWAPSIKWLAEVPALVPPDHPGWRLRRFVRRFRRDLNVLLQMFDRPLIRSGIKKH